MMKRSYLMTSRILMVSLLFWGLSLFSLYANDDQEMKPAESSPAASAKPAEDNTDVPDPADPENTEASTSAEAENTDVPSPTEPEKEIKETEKPSVTDYEASTLACVMECPKCSIFARAIHEAELENLLAQLKDCTIFVPTDDAFEHWTPDMMEALFSCKPALTALVLNHVCLDTLSPEDLANAAGVLCCCNYEDCAKMCGRAKAEHCSEFCPKMKEMKKCKQKVQDENGSPCLGSGKLCGLLPPFPNAVIRCKNGFVYAIDEVQIPHSLRVYCELRKMAAPVPVAELEEVEMEIPEETVTTQGTEETAPEPENGTASSNEPPANEGPTATPEETQPAEIPAESAPEPTEQSDTGNPTDTPDPADQPVPKPEKE